MICFCRVLWCVVCCVCTTQPLDIVSELDYLEERKEAEQKSAASKGRANNAALLAVGGAAAPAEPHGKQHVMDKAAAAGALQRTGGSVGSAGSAGGVALEPVGQPLNYPLLPPLHDTSSPASAAPAPAPAATASPTPAPGASSATYALALGGASPAPPTDNVVLASCKPLPSALPPTPLTCKLNLCICCVCSRR